MHHDSRDRRELNRGKDAADTVTDATKAAPAETSVYFDCSGMNLADDIPIPIGSFIASNLTPAGSLKRWSDSEIFRAIRNGVGSDGNWLTIMSCTNAGRLSDDDTEAVIAYIRTLPAAGAPTSEPPDRLSMLGGVVMLGAGLLPSAKPVMTGTQTSPIGDRRSSAIEQKGAAEQHGELDETHGSERPEHDVEDIEIENIHGAAPFIRRTVIPSGENGDQPARELFTALPQRRAATANESCTPSLKCKSNTDGI